MKEQLTRNNHYVPVWYQRQFLVGNESKLHYLDKSPGTKQVAPGRFITDPTVKPQSPQRCFCTLDLYTTQFGSIINDEIERFLFGTIDDAGAKAVRAFAAGDPRKMHESFEPFFEFLDAQKLRTPKGLDWIRSRYSKLGQLELMLEMQALRLMHCTMWTECVREIVSAEKSDVKFIITDHPVTIYNAAYPPDAKPCAYPSDPSIELAGSQTVFVLDADHCLILTNLEYAENPGQVSPTARRTNARFRGTSLVRTDAFIRTRQLSRDDVLSINYLLKRRARRFIAAGTESGLCPEKSISLAWEDIGKILLPQDSLWQFGGEIYVGQADGSVHYQDAFGRTSGAHKYLRKERHQGDLAPDAPCGCGSGWEFRSCCQGVTPEDRPSWAVFGMRDRNLMWCRAVTKILGLDSGKTWNDVRRTLSDEDVKKIHEVIASLWPVDTDLIELLPRPQKRRFRAIYLGISDPRTVAERVIGWLAYFDEVIVPHPFMNPEGMRPKYSPIVSPSQHKSQTLKNVLFLLELEPYIAAGYVHLIPDPADFSFQYRKATIQMAEARTLGWKPNRKEMGYAEFLYTDDLERAIKQLPLDSLRKHIQRQCPEFDADTVSSVADRMKEQLENDPCALLQQTQSGEDGAQAQIYKGLGLESTLYLANLTGSAICTDLEVHWRQLHQYVAVVPGPQQNGSWAPVVDAAKSLSLPIELNFITPFEARRNGAFNEIRSVFTDVFKATFGEIDPTEAERLAQALTSASSMVSKEWDSIPTTFRLRGHLELSIPQGGLKHSDITRLLLTYGRSKGDTQIPMACFLRTSQY